MKDLPVSGAQKPSLRERIRQQESWTFSEVLGLSGDYDMKVRMVIAVVYAEGKTYVERDLQSRDKDS